MTSFVSAFGCNTRKKPTVFTRVSAFNDWIEEVSEQDGGVRDEEQILRKQVVCCCSVTPRIVIVSVWRVALLLSFLMAASMLLQGGLFLSGRMEWCIRGLPHGHRDQ